MNTIPNFRGIWSGGLQGPRFPLYAWGKNIESFPTLGFSILANSPYVNDTRNQLVSSPIQVSNIRNWRKVILGRTSVVGITDQNTMWAWGYRDGTIWTSNITPSVTPVRVNFADDWQDFSFAQAANATILAIKTNGTLWAWGENASGQLGIGDTIDRSSPVQVGASGGWIAVSTSVPDSFGVYGTTLAIQGTGASGSLWSWGRNNFGQLGQGLTTSVDISSPVQIGSSNTWAKVYSCGSSSFAIRNDRTLWAWGRNQNGQLGRGNVVYMSAPAQVGALTDWIKVGSSSGSTIGLRANGTLWAWGDNAGFVGIGTNQNGFLGISASLFWTSSPVQIGSATDWSDFEISTDFVDPTILALKTNGTLWTWGSNSSGLLGRSLPSEILPSFTQVGALSTWKRIAAGGNNSFGIRSDGSLWAWGDNGSGRLGLLGVGPFTDITSPTRVGSLTGWVEVKTSGHTLAIRSAISNGATSGSLFAWGENTNGRLGIGNTTDMSSPVQVGANTDWFVVSVNPSQTTLTRPVHSCAIRTNGTLWAWGSNNYGQLGAGLTTSSGVSSPVQVGSGSTGPWRKVACSREATIGIQENGTMWSWGRGDSLSLGILGRTGSNSSSPVQIGSLTDWIDIACGEVHALALKSNGTLWSWGGNLDGQLGGTVIGLVSSPVQIGSNTDWMAISASENASFAIKSNNTLWAWGGNLYSTIDGSSIPKSSPVQIGSAAGWTAAAGGDGHLIALTTAGTLWARGDASYGQLGVGTFPVLVGGLTNPTQITGITASSLVKNAAAYSTLKGFLKRM